MIRTRIRSAYTNRSRRLELKDATKISMMPSRREPTMAPGRLPRPPKTAATKDLLVTCPMVGLTMKRMPYSMPAKPARTPPIRNTTKMTMLLLMPISVPAFSL